MGIGKNEHESRRQKRGRKAHRVMWRRSHVSAHPVDSNQFERRGPSEIDARSNFDRTAANGRVVAIGRWVEGEGLNPWFTVQVGRPPAEVLGVVAGGNSRYSRPVMPVNLTTEQVWRELEKRSFAVLGCVTPRGEARTAGIVYTIRDRQIYLTTGRNSWKARHIASNPHVSLTVTIPKRIPFVPWVHIPDATISFRGEASLHGVEEVPPQIASALLHGLEMSPEDRKEIRVIQVRPAGEFVTYGVGVPLPVMRRPEAARGRVAV